MHQSQQAASLTGQFLARFREDSSVVALSVSTILRVQLVQSWIGVCLCEHRLLMRPDVHLVRAGSALLLVEANGFDRLEEARRLDRTLLTDRNDYAIWIPSYRSSVQPVVT